MRVLLVRLSSLGDVVHAIPVASALRRAFPEARLDWIVDERYRELVELVPVIDRTIPVDTQGSTGVVAVTRLIRTLRREPYDVAIDVQGLLKSAVIARWSGARRVVGFPPDQLRERVARLFYTETPDVGTPTHVVQKNLALAACLGACPDDWEFPIAETPSTVVAQTRDRLEIDAHTHFALINPGAAWPSKCWEARRYGLLARRLQAQHGLRSAISWGPGGDSAAREVVTASGGAAALAPATRLSDFVALARAATVVVAGDTGPLHLAAAVGTPIVGVYGPSDPARNGPWTADDVVISRFDRCGCQRTRGRAASSGVVLRRCAKSRRCLDDVPVEEVADAVERRLATLSTHA